MLVKVVEFAELVGKSRAAVYKALNDERLEYASDGIIDTESTKAISFARSNRDNTGLSFDDLDDKERDELDKEKTREQIKKLRLENAIKTGEYIPRTMIHERVFIPLDDFFTKVIIDLPRSSLLSMKESIGAGLADGETEKRLKAISESYVKRIKKELAAAMRK